MTDRFHLGGPLPQRLPRLLVVGSFAVPAENGLGMEGVQYLNFADLTARALSDSRADLVLSALVEPGFDAIELASLLSELGFGGRYRALTGRIPDPEIIVSEIRAANPDLDFQIVICSGKGRFEELFEFDRND